MHDSEILKNPSICHGIGLRILSGYIRKASGRRIPSAFHCREYRGNACSVLPIVSISNCESGRISVKEVPVIRSKKNCFSGDPENRRFARQDKETRKQQKKKERGRVKPLHSIAPLEPAHPVHERHGLGEAVDQAARGRGLGVGEVLALVRGVATGLHDVSLHERGNGSHCRDGRAVNS